MRAGRILAARTDGPIYALAQLCEDRQDETLRTFPSPVPPNSTAPPHASSQSNTSATPQLLPQSTDSAAPSVSSGQLNAPNRFGFVPPRLNAVPSQTPHTVESSPINIPASGSVTTPLSIPRPGLGRLSPSGLIPSSSPASATSSTGDIGHASQVQSTSVLSAQPELEHMAPIRAKWTSPPPPEAPSADWEAFESRLGEGIRRATTSAMGHRPTMLRHADSDSTASGETDEETRQIGRAHV